MTFTIHDEGEIMETISITDEDAPIVTRHGTNTEMRQEVVVYDIDDVIAMYEQKITFPQDSKHYLTKKYVRLLDELKLIKEYLDD